MVCDQELIKKLKENPTEGIEEALDCYGGAIKKICESYLHGYSREDIEETISDCYVELWKGIYNFNPEKNVSLKSYFYGIARNQSLNQRRKLAARGSHPEVGYEEVKEEGIEIPDPLDTETMVENRLESEIVIDFIARMPFPDNEIFKWRYLESWTEKEIAKKMHLSIKAIEHRLARGKKRLKRELRNWEVMG